MKSTCNAHVSLLIYLFECSSGLEDRRDEEEKENLNSDSMFKSCEIIQKSSQESDRGFLKTNCLCVSLKNPACEELTCFVPSISNLCHFLCLLEECLTIRANHSGRHPEPYSHCEVYCYHCPGLSGHSKPRKTEHVAFQQVERVHILPLHLFQFIST